MRDTITDTILLVDDEEGIRTVLGITLEDAGYEVRTAADGREALSIFEEWHPAIVMTDIKMPVMDGIELLRKIKGESPDTEIIMITGHGDIDLAIKSLKFEATDFITKPINDDVLEIALKRSKERITMRRRLREYTENLEALVEEKSRRLVEAERLAAIGQTVAGLSHAIKNIAGGLKGGGFVLEKGIELDNPDYLNQGWEMIKGNVEKIKNLSMDLLNYAKPAELEIRPSDPSGPAREVAELMGPRAQEYGIALELKPLSSEATFPLDSESIHLCLVNLVSNAIDASREAAEADSDAGKEMQILLECGMAGPRELYYRITDNGIGMDPETKEKLFQRFFSTKGSRGTGIGLMITKKLIDEHGGVIEMESEKGRGSTFTIRLPRRS